MLLVPLLVTVFMQRPLRADSMRFLTDQEYSNSTSSTKNKATGEITESDYSLYSQLYTLDLSKELSPAIVFNGGGLFALDSTKTETDGLGLESKDRSISPYGELRLSTPILQAGTGFRRTEFKETASLMESTRRYSDQYTGTLDWKPVELPRVTLNYNRSLNYDEPLTTDSAVDSLELNSKYSYKDFSFDYRHAETDSLQKLTDSETLYVSDTGSVFFTHLYNENTVSVNAGTKYKRDTVEFSGTGARLVDASGSGISFYNLNDATPTSSLPEDFTLGGITAVNLLSSSPQQLSFGLDLGSDTEVDTVYVGVAPAVPPDNQASPSEIAGIAHLFAWSWSVYSSDDQTIWTKQDLLLPASYNIFENRFELSFVGLKSRYLKVVITPLNPTDPAVGLPASKEIRLSTIVPKRTLPADTSEFLSTTWNSNLGVNWKMSERTSSGYDMSYRQEEAKPFGERRTLLNNGAYLRHMFNKIFSGNMRLNRAELSENDGSDTVGTVSHTYSAALAGHYLETFNQALIYSYGHTDDDEEGVSSTNSLVLRNNLGLYQGWSMNLDNGYSWQYPTQGGKTTNTFARLSTSITPNRWMHVLLDYGISWISQAESSLILGQTGGTEIRRQTGGMLLSWMPIASLSLSGDLSFTDEDGDTSDSYTRQMYGVNWSPFPDGTLQFSLTCGDSQDTDGVKSTSLSPALKWQATRNTLLTLQYSDGVFEDEREETEFKNITLTLRIYY